MSLVKYFLEFAFINALVARSGEFSRPEGVKALLRPLPSFQMKEEH